MSEFEGFSPSNTTPVPDVLFDELLTELNGSELKVLLYIIRRTLGFKKGSDAISLTQFQKGITTQDKKILDKGCGITDRATIVKALESLETRGCIDAVKSKTAKGDSAITLYQIRFKASPKVVGKPNQGSGQTQPHKGKKVVGKPNQGSMENPTRVVGKPNPQETVLQETVLQETDKRNVITDTAHADVSTLREPLSENKVIEETKVSETESQVEADTNPPVKETIRKRRTGKSAQSKKNETQALLSVSEIAAPQKPDPTTHPYNGELFMKLADFYRGTELVYSADPKNRYQRAVAASLALIQRKAKFEEVDKVFRFLLGLDEIKDVKWIAGRFHTDLWTVEPHFSKKLLELEDAERTLRLADSKHSEKKETLPQEGENTLVPWTRKGDWEGNPIEHWEQFEIMTIKDAKQYGWTPNIFPRVTRNRILAKLRQQPAQSNVSA